MPLPQYADAVIFPPGRIKGSTSDRMIKIDKVFAPVLNCQKTRTHNQGSFNFTYAATKDDGTPAPFLSLLFPIGHIAERSERFTWHVATQDKKSGAWTVADKPCVNHGSDPESVKFGYLKPEPTEADDDGLVESSAAPSLEPVEA